MPKLKTVGVWSQDQWMERWREIADLVSGVSEDDPRAERIKGYLAVFDQEYQYKDCDWFFEVLVRFRNGFPEKKGNMKYGERPTKYAPRRREV